jgi:DNA-binding response OmpR family regulator
MTTGVRGTARARALIVDPDVRFGMLLKGFLEARGWSADWVSDGRQALRDWRRLTPDVLVTELQGDDLDGFEFVESIAMMDRAPPVVVCTKLAGAVSWDDATCQALGVRAVLVRPLQFPELLSVLERVFAEGHAESTLL